MAGSKTRTNNISRKDIELIIDQAITRAIQIQREQVLAALTSDDKEKTRAFKAILALKSEMSNQLSALAIEIQNKQALCKKDCNETIVKSAPNYLAIIGLAITIASFFIGWVATVHYTVWDLQLKIVSEASNSGRIQNIENWIRDKAQDVHHYNKSPVAPPQSSPRNGSDTYNLKLSQ